ncbi:MAG: cytochrome c biogenesis protein ResB [Desulfobacterales bacterium]|jgi:cytochrome c biogenesis protein
MKIEKQNNHMLDTFWDVFASVKLTVVVLILLAATSVVGTLIPQNADPALYMRAYGEFAYRMMHVLGIFDMYYSWWFQTLIGILTINITVCTIKRWPVIWKIVSSKKLQTRSTENKKPLSEFSDPRNPNELGSLYQAYVEKKYRNHKIEPEKAGFRVVAEKGRWTRLGVPAVHLSIVVILVGALVGSFFGFDGFVNIPEGESADYIRLRNSNDTLSLGFEVRCDDFDVSFYDSGAPKEFRSSLIILENGRKVAEKNIIVNDPLRYKGINFFQSSYGAMPPKNFQLSFTSINSDQNALHKLSIGQSVELPDGAGLFSLREYVRDYNFRGTRVGAAVMGTLDKPGKKPVEITLPLRFPTFDKMRKGDWIISVEGTDDAFYTGLQVTRDPGVLFVYAGFILLLLGCWVAFFMSHQKLVVDIQPSSNSSRIRVFGSTNRNRLGFENTARKLGEQLGKL